MRAAYVELHRLEFAHSIEARRGGQLVGGLYGVRLGGVFFGESMFSGERDASKVALAHLVRCAGATASSVIDCQLPSRHLESLGSRIVPRVPVPGSAARAHRGAAARPEPLPLTDTCRCANCEHLRPFGVRPIRASDGQKA